MPEAPDLIFSELLGGLGDNELSPECLRWAEKYLFLYVEMQPLRLCLCLKGILLILDRSAAISYLSNCRRMKERAISLSISDLATHLLHPLSCGRSSIP